jgi:hypothetical protein
MTSRRIFLKDGGLALVSLGFAPAFLARTAAASGARQRVLIAIFRAVFSEVVRGHLGLTDTSSVFPGFAAATRLGLL